MIGPVSGTGRAMMASLQQAIQKGMPPDQAIQYVKSMATQGVAPLADLYAMMNQFQRLKQQPVQAPQTPPTIRDQLNMAEQQQAQQQMAMQQGLGGMPAPVMEQAQFAGGGIVAFAAGSEDAVSSEGGVEAEIERLESALRTDDYIKQGLGGSFGRAVASRTLPMGYAERLEAEKKLARLKNVPRAEAAPDFSLRGPPVKPSFALSSAYGLPQKTDERTGLPIGLDSASSAVATKPDVAPAPKPDAAPPAPARKLVAAAPRAATAAPAVAAPKMPSVADFEQQLQERNKPFVEATERYRSFLQGEEATSKEEAKRDRLLALAQAGFAMAQEGSKPGATFLGSAGAAGSDFTKSMTQLNREAAVARRNMQKELLALDQAKAANDVNMYNVAYQNYTKDRDFVTQVDQFNQGMDLKRTELALQRSLGYARINAEMTNSLIAAGVRKDEAAVQAAERLQRLRLEVYKAGREAAENVKLTEEYQDESPEGQAKMLQAAFDAEASRIGAYLGIGAMGGATSDAVSAADRIVGIGGTR